VEAGIGKIFCVTLGGRAVPLPENIARAAALPPTGSCSIISSRRRTRSRNAREVGSSGRRTLVAR
jgi:hypothetical protein